MSPLQLDDAVDAVPGVGTKTAQGLAKTFGMRTVRDLVEHYPRRHQDLGDVTDLDGVTVGEPATLIGRVSSWDTRPTRTKRGRRLHISEATVEAAGGGVFGVTFFNQAWRERQLRAGTVAAFSAKVSRFRGKLRLQTPEVQILEGTDEHGVEHHRLLAVYPASEAFPSWKLERFVAAALDELPAVPDYLDEALLDEHDLVALDEALRGIHRPPDRPTRDAARKRLVFDELFTLQLGLQWRRAHLEAELVGKDNRPRGGEGLARRFLGALPFDPTDAQQRAFDEIGADLAADRPMHRLLQGDVGAGKTLVATWAMLCAVDNTRQAALMAPTEVLAEQHHRTLLRQLEPLGVNLFDGIRVELLTSSTTTSEKRRILGHLLTGEVNVVVGTHALLEEDVRFADLGVVVIDEQHRFGVSQRVRLKEKGEGAAVTAGQEAMPDVLVMTATPIPRSLALTLYGDLDVTVLDELPPGRKPIVTQLITPAERDRRERVYAFVADQAAAGLQTYVVCPLVEDSEEIAARSATEEHARLVERFPDLDVALVHGRMRSDEKEAAMTRFRNGDADILVATTVIEVGVDVPNASVMIVEDAERFGISQLHQLRGRVGRGADKSYCVLFAGWHGELTDEAQQRLEAVTATTDGFVLAERDLEIRGEGQLFGQRQSGMPDLRIARLQRDLDLIAVTRQEAQRIIAADPHLHGHPDLRAEVLRRYEGGLEEFAALETG